MKLFSLTLLLASLFLGAFKPLPAKKSEVNYKPVAERKAKKNQPTGTITALVIGTDSYSWARLYYPDQGESAPWIQQLQTSYGKAVFTVPVGETYVVAAVSNYGEFVVGGQAKVEYEGQNKYVVCNFHP